MSFERGPARQVYDGPAGIAVANPLFDVTPATRVTSLVTEESVVPAEVVDIAAEHARRAAWRSTADDG